MSQTKEIKMKWVVLANFFNNAGAAFLWPLTTVYMHNYLHQTLATAGVVLFIMSCAMIIGNYLGGWLFDHWQPYKTALASVSVATTAVILLIFFHSWPIFAILLVVIGFGDGANITVINAYAASLKNRNSRYVFNILYMALNLGVVVGTLLVGFLLSLGVTVVFAVTSLCYVAFLILILCTFNVKVSRDTSKSVTGPNKTHPQVIKFVWTICLVIVTTYLSYALWESVMAVHMTNMHIPFYAYSLLWTMNGFLILFGQPLVNKLAPYLKLTRQVEVGVLIFAVSFFILIFAHTFAFFIVDFIILTVGEMLGLPGMPALIDQVTDPSETGKYQGMANMGISVGRAIGPLYGGIIIDHGSYPLLFVSVSALMVVSLILMTYSAKRVRSLE